LRAGNTQLALKLYKDGLEIRSKLSAADPDNVELQSLLAVSYSSIAGFHLKANQLKEAFILYQQILPIAEKLVAQDPLNTVFQNNLKLYQQKMTEIKQQMEESAQEKE